MRQNTKTLMAGYKNISRVLVRSINRDLRKKLTPAQDLALKQQIERDRAAHHRAHPEES